MVLGRLAVVLGRSWFSWSRLEAERGPSLEVFRAVLGPFWCSFRTHRGLLGVLSSSPEAIWRQTASEAKNTFFFKLFNMFFASQGLAGSLFWRLLEASLSLGGHLRGILEPLGARWDVFGWSWGASQSFWVGVWLFWSCLEAEDGPSLGGFSGRLRAVFGPSRDVLGASWGTLLLIRSNLKPKKLRNQTSVHVC